MYKKQTRPVRSIAFKKLMTKVLVKMGRGTKIEGSLESDMRDYIDLSRRYKLILREQADIIEEKLDEENKRCINTNR